MNAKALPHHQRLRQHWKPVLHCLVGVIDLMDGVAVHGVAGNRSRYQPIAELSADECELLKWYRAIGVQSYYVADLDGLMGKARQHNALLAMARELCPGETLWIDCGWAGAISRFDREWLEEMHRSIAKGSGLRWIIATESADSIDVCKRMLEVIPASCLVLSLDFRGGEFIGSGTAADWVLAARQTKICEAILLDVALVGSQSGPPNREAFSELVSRFEDVVWTTGGGIRDLEDVQSLLSVGYSAFLVASALLPKPGIDLIRNDS